MICARWGEVYSIKGADLLHMLRWQRRTRRDWDEEEEEGRGAAAAAAAGCERSCGKFSRFHFICCRVLHLMES